MYGVVNIDILMKLVCSASLLSDILKPRPAVCVPADQDIPTSRYLSSVSGLCLKPECVEEDSKKTYDLLVSIDHLMSLLNVSNICTTPGCTKAAADILYNLDETVNPCDNFYKFACGAWSNRQDNPNKNLHFNILSEIKESHVLKLKRLLEKKLTGDEPYIITKLKEMYDSCMDVQSIEDAGSEPLKKALSRLGGWPVVEGQRWNESSFSWIDTIIKMRNLGFSPDILLKVSVSEDPENSTIPIITVDKPSIKIMIYSNDTDYLQLMVKAANQLGAHVGTSEQELKESFIFESMFSVYYLTYLGKRSSPSICNKCNIKELTELLPQVNGLALYGTHLYIFSCDCGTVDWSKYFRELLGNEIVDNALFVVKANEFLPFFAETMNETNNRVLANYMMWRVVEESLPFMSKNWRNLKYRAPRTDNKKEDSEVQEKPRWKQCLAYLRSNLGVALSSFYVHQYFTESSKNALLQIKKRTHQEAINMLENIPWIDDKTKEQAKYKAKALKSHTEYLRELLDYSYISKLHSTLKLTSESYFDKALEVREWSTRLLLSGKSFIKEGWKNSEGAAESFYDPLDKHIGYLAHPLFNGERSQSLNFGAIGFVIAKALIKEFDETVRVYEKEDQNHTNAVGYWTVKLYRHKTLCVKEQHCNHMLLYDIERQKILEDVIDRGALRAAYLAYESWTKDHKSDLNLPGLKYTQNQLFFISAANAYCAMLPPDIKPGDNSPEFRVNEPMSNLPEFSRAFNCAPGSRMNRKNKCQVW